MSTLFAFLHHVAAFTLVAAIVTEAMLIRLELTAPVARRIVVADAILGASAAVVLIVGLLRVFYFEKGAEYYWSSHAFLTKFGVFILVGILSAVPTIEFLSWRKALRAGQAPSVAAGKLKTIRTILMLEQLGVIVILLMAALTARGGWV